MTLGCVMDIKARNFYYQEMQRWLADIKPNPKMDVTGNSRHTSASDFFRHASTQAVNNVNGLQKQIHEEMQNPHFDYWRRPLHLSCSGSVRVDRTKEKVGYLLFEATMQARNKSTWKPYKYY